MKAWLISIVGVVFLGVLVDIISPEGKTNTFIKSIFGVFVIYIIIQPIFSLMGKDIKVSFDDIVLQEDYLESVANVKVESIEGELRELIYNAGYENIVEIDGKVYGNTFDINKITIFLEEDVLFDKDKHINNCKVITQIVKQVVDVDEEVITYESM